MSIDDVKSESKILEPLAIFEGATCVGPKTCFKSFMERIPSLLQNAPYVYNFAGKIDLNLTPTFV